MPTSRNFDLSQSVTSRDENVDDRVAALLVGGANITVTYDDVAGTLTVDGQSGYTDTDVGNYLSTNGYDTATNIVATITDSAPTTLDTLNELAAALGDDPNFATTVTNQIGTKLATADFNTTADTWLGTKSTFTISSTDDSSSAGPVLELYRNSATPASADYIGQVQFSGENSNGGTEIYAKVTGKITDPTLSSEDALIETAIKGGGSFTIVSRQRSDELQLINGVGLSVAGDTTLSGTLNTHTIPTGTGTLALTSDIPSVTLGGSLTGTLGDVTVQYGTSYSGTPAQGSFFFDSLNQKLKVYTGSAFVDAVPAGSGGGGGGATGANATFTKYTYSITSSTNSVSGADDNAETLSYVTTGEQNVEVYVNGVKQVEGAANDYVATTGTSVTFVDNLSSGDVVDVQVYELLTNDAYYLKTETYTQTETNSQISTALSGAISPSSATINDIEINRILSPTDYTYIKKTSTGSNLAITSPESIYLNIDSNNDQTNRALFIVTNTDQPGSGTVIAKFQEDGNIGIGTESPNTVTNYRSLHIDGSVGSLIDMGASGLESRIVADTNGLGFQVTPGSHTYQNIRWKAGQISGATDSHMLLQSSGNLGIGTVSPQTTLDTGYTRVYNSGAAASPSSGKGLEVHYVTSGRTQGEGAYLISYDRDTSAYKPITTDANNINLATGGTTRLQIYANGNISVGHDQTTTKISKTFTTTHDPSNRGKNIRFGMDDGSFAGMEVSTHQGSNASFNSQSVSFYYHDGAIVAAEGMKLDHRGRVTTPYQPGFRAGRNSNYTPGSSVAIVFNTTSGTRHFNDGGHYSTSNGRFTAPVAGKYFFTTMVIWGPGVGDNTDMTDSFRFRINGANVTYSNRRAKYRNQYTGTDGYYTDTCTDIFKMSAGDYIEVWSQKTVSVHGNDQYTIFSGYLIG